MELHELIRDTRKDKDMGQKEMAALLGITQQQYSLYETGKRKLPAEMLAVICAHLGVSADYLLDLPKGLAWPR